jgi:hypothetical protein
MIRPRFCDVVEKVLREQMADSIGQEDALLLGLIARQLRLPLPESPDTHRRILAAIRSTPGALMAREARLTSDTLPKLKIVRFWLAEKAPPKQTAFC